jgi:Asp-tRNA(Asn)/Glu-tRNA(Gln) amidotransferase B subunit
VSDEPALEVACAQAIEADPRAAADFGAGNDKALGRLVGLAMKRLGGKGNPVMVNAILKRRLRG